MEKSKIAVSKIAWNVTQAKGDLTEILIYDKIADKQSYNWWTDEKGTEITPLLFKEELDKISTAKICVRINSGGGDVFAAEAIRTAISDKRQEGKEISCKIDGFCGSAAVGIAMACESIAISSSSYFMIHDPIVFAYGYYNASDFNKGIEMLNTIKQGIINAYAKKTGKDKKEISDLMAQETWYTGDEAVEKGFCDELMFEDEGAKNSFQNAANLINLNMQMYHNAPISLLNNRPDNKGGFLNRSQTKNNKEGENMEIKTVDELKKAYPELTNQIEKDAQAAERKRIQDIEGVMVEGFETIANEAKFDKPASAADVAIKIIAEQKKQGANYLANREKDVDDSGVKNVTPKGHEGIDGKDKKNPYDEAIDQILPEKK